MNMSDFHALSNLYASTKDVNITQHFVRNPILRKFCLQLYSFENSLGDTAEHDYWRNFLIPLKRIRFGLCAAIFTTDYLSARIGKVISVSKTHLTSCEKLYPDAYQQAVAIVDNLECVFDEIGTDPLKNKLIELSSNMSSVHWVIKESRLINDVESLVQELGFGNMISVLHPRQLRGLTTYERLIFVGPSRWFPESSFAAPRSDDIHLTIYDWISDPIRFTSVFEESYKSSRRSNRPRIRQNREIHDSETIDPEKMLIHTNKLAVVQSKISRFASRDYDKVDALSVFLEGDWVVFIDASENANTLIIDLEQDIEDRIQRIPVTEIQTGSFILVRTGGGEDYIVPVANRILGPEANKARELQQNWKKRLRQHVDQHGLLNTSVKLLDLGSEIANEINVRNWMSPRSISTRNYTDFHAIMQLTNLQAESTTYWEYMKKINRAHRSAGYKIRDLLLEQVRDVDVDLLQKRGKMDFKIDDDDDGGITAFRVESVSSEKLAIPYSQTGQLIGLDNNVWQE